jgi:hypothetical protein
VVSQWKDFLNTRTNMLCSLQEIVMLLQRNDDLIAFSYRKVRAAIIDKNPRLQISA